jgi:tryptophanyl-tRNA synthetase
LTNAKNRVLSGMRPTGRLHIGHYFGALQNWVKLQNDPAYDCFYFIADWHALTSDYADTSAIAENSLQITIDYLAAGLDPEKSVLFLQSLVPEHAELHLLLSMVTPLGWLERIPTYKEQIENVSNKDLHTYGFLGYPTLQTADIVMYSDPGKTLSVPVGEDQVSHVEFSRELVKKFNFHNIVLDTKRLLQSDPETAMSLEIIRDSFSGQSFSPGQGAYLDMHPTEADVHELEGLVRKRVSQIGINNWIDQLDKSLEDRVARDEHWKKQLVNFSQFKGNNSAFRSFYKEVLVEPQALLTPTPRLPGLDGRKMSKSYGNAINLSESDEDIRKKTKTMVTDPARKRRTDPGNPDICPVYDWHKLFSTEERDPGRLDWVQTGCRTAGIGCIECKDKMATNLIKWIEPIREKRVKWENNKNGVLEILDAGSAKAQVSAKQTMQRVREAIFNWPRKRQEIAGL